MKLRKYKQGEIIKFVYFVASFLMLVIYLIPVLIEYDLWLNMEN